MTRKKCGGFAFVSYKGDHPPYHVHVEKDGIDIGRWDIENQRAVDDLQRDRLLKDALKRLGHLL